MLLKTAAEELLEYSPTTFKPPCKQKSVRQERSSSQMPKNVLAQGAAGGGFCLCVSFPTNTLPANKKLVKRKEGSLHLLSLLPVQVFSLQVVLCFLFHIRIIPKGDPTPAVQRGIV